MEKTPSKPRKEIKVKGHVGIYKLLYWDYKTKKHTEQHDFKKYRAMKFSKGKRETRMFYTLREAVEWRNNCPTIDTTNNKPKSPLISEVWGRYQEAVFPSLEKSSIETKLYRKSFKRN